MYPTGIAPPAHRAVRYIKFRESQQRFSDRIRITARTVARYEVQKPPTGEMLGGLAALAEEVGCADLRAVFTNAF